MSGNVFTVSEINTLIKQCIEQNTVFNSVYVRGELSNYKIYPSGHHYFTLKDSQSAIRCVCFKSSAMRLRFRPENGMKVTVCGSIQVYLRDGTYQLYCNSIIPDGIGDLQIAFEQSKKKLEEKGYFSAACKKPIPSCPSRIAIITSPAGAAVHDMIRILNSRWPISEVILLPVKVQGEGAAEEIASAIQYANEWKLADVIIAGRGGGSIEDLWAFNEECVCDAAFRSDIPIISAVGHEPDVTLLDYVADRRASTPSNAAEIAVPNKNNVFNDFQQLTERLKHAMDAYLNDQNTRFERISGYFISEDRSDFVDELRLELDRLYERMIIGFENVIQVNKLLLSSKDDKLNSLCPYNVLKRGYSLAFDAEGDSLAAPENANVGDKIRLRFYAHEMDCTINNINYIDNVENC